MGEDEPLTEFFDDKLNLYELMDLRQLDREQIDSNMSRDDLNEQAIDIARGELPDSKEEGISFVFNSLNRLAERDPEAFLQELQDSKKRDIEKRLKPYSREEIAPFSKITATITKFSDTQLEIAGEWLKDFHKSNKGKSYSQGYHQLVYHKLDSNRKVSIPDAPSISFAIDVLSDAMNVYDEGYSIPVALSRITDGKDPRDADLASMGMGKSLDELKGTSFDAMPSHIDYGLRNTIKHGDYIIDPHNNELKIEEGNRVLSGPELERSVNATLLAVNFLQVSDTYISLTYYRRNFEFLE
jgi:hypothetical protein